MAVSMLLDTPPVFESKLIYINIPNLRKKLKPSQEVLILPIFKGTFRIDHCVLNLHMLFLCNLAVISFVVFA